MRTLSASVTTQYATEPIIVIKVEWDSGTVYYGEKALTWSTDTVKGDITSISNLNNTDRDTELGDVSDVSLVLNDSDGSIKDISDTDILEGTLCTVYQVYAVNNVVTESNILLKGKISGDIKWIEGDRSFTCSVESALLDGEIGYAPNSDDISDLSDEATGKMWPLCFGKPLRVPAVRLRKTLYGTLRGNVTYGTTSVIIEGGIDFPQTPTIVTIYIKGVKCTGTFSGNTFTFATQNDAYYTSLAVNNREAGDYINDYSVLWLVDTTANIENKFCNINHPSVGWISNYCSKQVGTRCHFIRPWKINHGTSSAYLLIGNTCTIAEVAQYPRTSWSEDFTCDSLIDGYNAQGDWIVEMPVDLWVEVRDSWNLHTGESVKYLSTYNEMYIINNMASTSLLEVMAYRQVKKNLTESSKERELVVVPSDWYTKNLNNTIDGQTCTTITFIEGLDDSFGRFAKYEFEGDIFITVNSSVGENIADIIQYLIETYSDYAVDAASFLSVHNEQVIFPCNFALSDKKSTLEVCNDIAWQARCALYVRNGIIFLKYLSTEPVSTDLTLDTNNILLKSINLGFTTIEDLVTYFTANWQTDYSDAEGKDKVYIYKDQTSIDKFGMKEQEYDFYIYNQESLVKISADFWGYRYGHIWRKLYCTSILSALKLEVYDTVSFDVASILTNILKGDVISASYSHDSPEIPLEIQLASQAGTVIEDPNYWDIGSHSAPADPTIGLTELDYDPIIYNEDSGAANNDNNEQASDKYYLRITVGTNSIGEVTRGENFSISLRLEDEAGKQVAKTCRVALTLHVSSGIDSLNYTSTTLVGGKASTATAKITGSTGRKTCFIKVAPLENPEKYKGCVSITFDVVSANAVTVTPATTTFSRGVYQAVTVTGAPKSEIYISWINGTDAGDDVQVYSGSPIVLDDAGTKTINMKITGGIASGTGKIRGTFFKHDGNFIIGDSATITINENRETVGDTDEGDEALDSTEFFMNTDDKGLELNIMTRVAYFTGSHTLWGYIRTLKFTNEGKLAYISGETRITIDSPESCV
ncbi:MAG: hypothetical protein M0R80_26685 [Proteobacteria bacterium]|jgi:hypothetical protein|nr:hypothetical protein [Pseudomonadota bacterium]